MTSPLFGSLPPDHWTDPFSMSEHGNWYASLAAWQWGCKAAEVQGKHVTLCGLGLLNIQYRMICIRDARAATIIDCECMMLCFAKQNLLTALALEIAVSSACLMQTTVSASFWLTAYVLILGLGCSRTPNWICLQQGSKEPERLLTERPARLHMSKKLASSADKEMAA